jgi:HlyD family secretion protein
LRANCVKQLVKKFLILAVILAAAGWGAVKKVPALWIRPQLSPALASRPTTATVERRDIQFSITAAGEIGPSEQVSMRPEVNGRIKDLPVDLGDKIKKGDILFTLDDSDLQIEKAARETEIEAAQLQVEKCKRNWTRCQELFAAKLISQEVYDDTKTEYEQAKNAFVRTTQNLNLVKERLLKTKIQAPFDCTVLTRPVSVGQAVSGSGGFNSGTEVLTIADLTKMIINAHVNQADVIRLSTGQEVEIQVDSVAGLTMHGIVERIAPQAAVKNGIKGYPVRIVISDANEQVRPGMTANLFVPVASRENAVAVPLAAVFTEQGERFVYVQKGTKFEKRNVQMGIADYDYAEVLGGLYPGDIVSLEDREKRSQPSAANNSKPAAETRRGKRSAASGTATNAAAPTQVGKRVSTSTASTNR